MRLWVWARRGRRGGEILEVGGFDGPVCWVAALCSIEERRGC